MVDVQNILGVVGLILTMIVYAVGIIKYIVDKVETSASQEAKNRKELEDSIRKELDIIKEAHVRRDDHNRHVDNMEKQLMNITNMFTTMAGNLTNRLDSLVAMVAQLRVNKSE